MAVLSWAFQFLGRNSGRSDALASISEYVVPGASFNSSVGILVVRTKDSRTCMACIMLVSIPRSEFWSFGPTERFMSDMKGV